MFTLHCEIGNGVPPENALCAVISDSRGSEGRRKLQLPPSRTVLVLRAE